MAGRVREIDPGKVAVYIRWSTDDQGDGTTLDVQREGSRHYILSQGWDYTDDLVFIDDGYSGGTLDRPALTALREAVAQGRVDCVVVFKLDRLSRSVVDTVNLVLEEWEGRCHVKSAREPIDTTTHAGKMFFYMLVSYAEWERAVIRERTFAGKVRRAQEGRNPGFRPPYGYVPAPEGASAPFAVDQAEATTIRQIYGLYRQGLGVTAVAHRLNGAGARFREGRLWHESTVAQILKNPIYCGDLHYGRRSRNPARATRPGEPFYLRQEPLVVRAGAVPPIIAREEWLAVQAARAGRPGAGPAAAGGGRAFSSPHLLTSIARCACGAAMIAYKGGGKADFYYRCSAQRKKGPVACLSGYIRQEMVDELVLTKLVREFGDQVAQDRYLERVTAEAQSRSAAAQAELVTARKALVRLEEAEARIRKLFREGELTLPEYREQRADMAAEGRALKDRAARLEAADRDAAGTLALQAQEAEFLAQVPQVRRLSPEHRKQLLRHFVAALTLYRDPIRRSLHLDIRWKWTSTARPAETEISDFADPTV